MLANAMNPGCNCCGGGTTTYNPVNCTSLACGLVWASVQNKTWAVDCNNGPNGGPQVSLTATPQHKASVVNGQTRYDPFWATPYTAFYIGANPGRYRVTFSGCGLGLIQEVEFDPARIGRGDYYGGVGSMIRQCATPAAGCITQDGATNYNTIITAVICS